MFQDEVHFQITTSVTRKWVLRGSKPQVKSAPGRKNAPYSGFVCPATGELIVTKPDRFNYATVIKSFRVLLQNYRLKEGQQIYLILDNAPWHKKAVRLIQTEALPEYQDIRDKMTLIFLPPYSPDLNPIELLWRVTRREVTHNVYFPDDEILATKLDSYFEGFREPNQKIASLCSIKNSN